LVHEGSASEELEVLFPGSGAEPVHTPKPIVNFDAARTVFKRAMQQLEHAKEYFVLDGYVSDHVAIVTDQSALYRQLAIFEQDGDRKVKMHRRRAVRRRQAILYLRLIDCLVTASSASASAAASARIACRLSWSRSRKLSTPPRLSSCGKISPTNLARSIQKSLS
jgi:hypothetical protein